MSAWGLLQFSLLLCVWYFPLWKKGEHLESKIELLEMKNITKIKISIGLENKVALRVEQKDKAK